MITSDPNETFTVKIRNHLDADKRPSFTFYHLTRAERKQAQRVFDTIPDIDPDDDAAGDDIFDRLAGFLLQMLTGWANLKKRNGDHIPYKPGDKDALDSALSDAEVMQLYTKVMFSGNMDVDDAKKSEPQSDTSMGQQGEVAAIEKTENAKTAPHPQSP